ncbi:hypothetical protein C7S16_4367 [Burkholderia thailandensis]|uniref:Secreted protein n=1 Tax=Burkholderia thailandensis TaxID=57975 RepID=A0AAW9CQN2_BURTH|nr:hypothetical protein [Burkholderia thailandensis]
MIRRPRGCRAATMCSAFLRPIPGHFQRIPSLRRVSRDYCSKRNTVMQKMQRPCWCITFLHSVAYCQLMRRVFVGIVCNPA